MILAGFVPWRESSVTMLMQLGSGENFKNQDFFVDIWSPLIAMDDCNLHESVVNYFKVHSKCFVEM